MNSYALGKKGQAPQNIIIGILFLFLFGIQIIMGALITLSILTEYEGSSFYNSAMGAAIAGFRSALRVFDYITVFAMFAFIIGIGVTSFRLATRPVFFVVTFVLAAFYGFIAYIFDYIFQEIVKNSAFSTVVGLYPKTILICTNLEWVALAIVVVGAFALYAKREQGQYVV